MTTTTIEIEPTTTCIPSESVICGDDGSVSDPDDIDDSAVVLTKTDEPPTENTDEPSPPPSTPAPECDGDACNAATPMADDMSNQDVKASGYASV
ncbi:unnamed protein product [Sphagnum balticum]